MTTKPTREEVLSADPYELSLLAAEHVALHRPPFVKGLVPCPDGRPGCCVAHLGDFDAQGVRLPDYSDDLAAAWRLVEAVRRGPAHEWCPVEFALSSKEDGTWSACFLQLAGDGTGATPAEAICRAAVLAVVPATVGGGQ